MSYFRFHNRNLINLFIVDFVNKLNVEENNAFTIDDLSDIEYSNRLFLIKMDEFILHIDDTLLKIFNFDDSFISSDIQILNINNLKFELNYNFNELLYPKNNTYMELYQYPIISKDSNFLQLLDHTKRIV